VSLRTYRAKRDFRRTPEPAGAEVPGPHVHGGDPEEPGGRFVIHRHRARRLHYDLRLEVDGVLASWAVPRGPSRDPAARRLAVQVEDHPLGYFGFEGVIPAGEYGGGDVIVWDWGQWTAEPGQLPTATALRAGQLKFRLEGEKLAGGFVLVRTAGWRNSERSRAKWLLIHRRDAAALEGWDAEDFPESVKSGRTNDEVADGAPARRRGHPPRARRT
jgi:bifunctional non-homologous end joining protein LigD